MNNFYGHKIVQSGLVENVVYVLLSICIFWIWTKDFNKKSRLSHMFLGGFFVLLLPNTTYAFLEIKHLLLPINGHSLVITEYLVYGFISALGFTTNVALITLAAKKLCKKYWAAGVLLFSALSGIGSILGLYDLTSLVGLLFPFTIVQVSIEAFAFAGSRILASAVTILLSLVCFATAKAAPKELK